LKVDDTVNVAGIYVVSSRPGLRAELQKTWAALVEGERALAFDPAGNDRDFEILRSLTAPSR
jgi:hypothetical protein